MKKLPHLLVLVVLIAGFTISSISNDRDVVNESLAPTNTLEQFRSTIGTVPQHDNLAVLYNQSELVSNPGAGAGGADASAITDPGTTFGYGNQITANNRMADDFTIPSGETWQIDSIILFHYQTGSTTTSTINNINLQIWDGATPGTGSIVAGDSTTNRLTASNFSNIYRVTATTLTNSQRPIMRSQVSMTGTTLGTGTYWIDYCAGGSLSSGPWNPPRTIPGTPNTGNGYQRTGTTWTWAPVLDGSNPQGLPFIIYGSIQGGPPPVGNKFVDSLNGANDTTALKSRGYLVYYRGTGPQGTTATWFQGNQTVFPAFNGPPTGYVAANYNVVTGMNDIDSWLVLPALNIVAGDTISFWEQGAAGSWPDSMRVMYSASGDSTPEGSWVELGRFKNTQGSWANRIFMAPAPGSHARFAIRYCVVDGGPSGNNSNYLGVDYIQVNGTIVGVGNEPEITADQYSLSQNYPNPFNPVTKINFSIPQSGFVSMKVYDAMGREVATLVSENKTQGTYTVEFNGADFSSGVYFVRMQAGDFSQVRKMMLLK
ncbi:MAG: hypothetical protein CDJEALGM_00226 [Ignavibacteria bacterium]|nr:hypothetical protein [Ignavibacteria bacterium]